MASTQGEIRVGPSHQARLPDYRSGLSSAEVALSSPDADLNHVREDLRWIPAMTLDTDLLMYLRAARSMAAFAGMCDGGSPDDGCIAASRDDTTINALDMLHDAGYDPAKALQALVKCPVPKGIDKKWSEEETKRFVKGLRQFGKNFFRIRKDLLPHKDTSELVEFYYLWKKTPGANNNRPHRRNRRQGSLRRIRNTRNTRGGNNQAKEMDASSPVSTSAGSTTSSRPSPNSKDQAEGSSGSEEENSEDENSDSRDNSSLRCQHCFSTNSRDWQQSGKDRSPLCSECRAYSKKYGELPPLINNPNVVNSVLTPGRGEAPYLFRPVQNLENSEDFSGRMRTRTRSKEQTAGNRPQHGNGTDTPESEMDKKLSKSPASNACSPSDKNKKKSKSETPTKGRKRGQMDVENEDEKDMALFKRRRNDRAESPAESLTTDSGSMVDDGDTNEQDNESSENAASCVVGSATESSGNNVFQSELSLPIDKVESVGSSVTSSLITNVSLSSSSSLHQPQFTPPPPPPPPLVQNLQSSVQIALSPQMLSRPSLPPPSGSIPLHPVNAGVVPSGVVGSVSNSNVCSTVSSPAAVSSIIGSGGGNCDGMSISGDNGNLVATGTVTNSSILNATINTTLTSNTAVNISNGANATSAAMNSYPCGTAVATVPTPTTSAISNISAAQSNSKFNANIPLCFPTGSAASAFSSSLIPSAATAISSGGSLPTSVVDVDSPTNGVNVSESTLPSAGSTPVANAASVITTTASNAAVSTITTIAPSVAGTTSGYLAAVSDISVHGSAGHSSCSSPATVCTGLSSSSPSIASSIIANTTTCTTTTTTTSVASSVGSLSISPNSTSGDLSSTTIIITAALTSTSTSSVSSTCASTRTSLNPSAMAETISNTLCTSATDNVGGVDSLGANSVISATSGSVLCAFESSDTCPPSTTYVTPTANTDAVSSISLLNPNVPLAPPPVKLGPAMTSQLPYVPGEMVLGVRNAPLSLKTQGSECSHEPHVRCGQGAPCANSSGLEGIRVADIAVIDKMNKDVISSDEMKVGFDRDIVKLSNTLSFSHCAVKHEGLKLEKLEKEGEFHCSNEDNFYKARREVRISKTEFDKKDQSIISCFKGVEDISTGMSRNPHIKEEMDSSNDGMMNVSLSGNLPLKDSMSPVSSCPTVMSAPFSNSSAGGKSGSSNVMSKNFQKVTPSIKLEPGLGCEEQTQHSNLAEESGDMNPNDLPNLPSAMARVTSSASESSSVVDVSSSLAVGNSSPRQGTSNSAIIRQTVSDDLSLGSSLDKESYPPGNYEEDGHDKLSHLQNPLSTSEPGSQHNVSQGNPNQTSVVSQGFNFLHASSYHNPQRFGSSNEENVKKILTSNNMSVGSAEINQNEPQNLKIKQEVITQSDQVSSDPLQSLKEVKIPGYSGSNLSLAGNSVNMSQSASGFGVDIQRSPSGPEPLPFLGPSVENIKKEPDSFVANSDSNVAPPAIPASALKTSAKLQPNIADSGNSGMPSLRSSPLARAIPEAPLPTPISSTHVSVPHSAVSLISPSRLTPTSLPSAPSGIPNPILHPAQQSSPIGHSSPGHPHPTPHPHPSPHPHSSPFIGPPSTHPVLHHHPHTLIHHSLFAAAAQAAAVHHNPYHPPHPYAAYGYPFPYHYGHLPQHHPLPPHHSPPASVVAAVSAASALPQRSTHESVKVERPPIECPTSLNSSSNTSHSSSSRREILANDDIVPYANQPSERHHAQEIVSPFGHHQSHLSLHSIHAEKPGHSTSQPSSLPLQPSISAAASTSHKANTPGKCVSAANRSSPTCHNAPIMSTVPPTSTSVTLAPSNLQHSHGHHHQLLHHSPSIPGGTGGGCTESSTTANSLLNHSAHNVSSNPRAHHPNPGHHSSLSYHAKHNNHPVLMVQPPALNHQGIGLGLTPSVPASSLEALRAHAQAAANVQQQQQQQQQQLQLQQQQIQCNPSLQSSGLQLAIMHSSPHSPLSVPGPHQLPSRHLSQGFSDDMKMEPAPEVTETQPEEEIPSPSHIPRGPSPEPKIEDTECHRSQSAIFLRHWNRGDFNSCARTDLTFKPVPDSKLARKREERLRKQAEREREEREKAASQSHSHKLAAAEKAEASKPPSRGPIETITSPYDRFTPRQGYDTPALRQLSEYARPHAGFSPGTLPRSTTLGLTAQCIDPLLHYQLNSMYGPGARERLELEQIEREKRERDIRELRERELNDRLKDELIKSAGTGPRMASSLDAHCLDLQRRYAGLGPSGPAHQFGLYTSPAAPGQTALNQLERERLERLGIPTGPAGPLGPAAVGPSGPHSAHAHPHAAAHASSVAAAQAAQAQLEAAERLALATDPMVRLQMAGISPEYHAHTHAHTHAHSHTHLHLHPGQQAAQAQAAQQAAAQQEAAAAVGAGSPAFPLAASAGATYPRPSLIPGREPSLALHHPPELLGRNPGYADQLAHQLSAQAAHEQLQRQIMMERERFPHPHASLVAQHEEYLRQQREREMKVRALEEAARGSRP